MEHLRTNLLGNRLGWRYARFRSTMDCDGELDVEAKMTEYRGLWRMSVLTKGILLLSTGVFGLLVGWTNLTAYDINFAFVQHVLSMDTLQPWARSEALMQRAITSIEVHQWAYAAIIAAELLMGLLCTVAGLLFVVVARQGTARHLSRAKVFALAGLVLGLLIWYFGFAVIGAEYFAMWANQSNAQTTAYLFSGFLLVAMIYVAQPEPSSGAISTVDTVNNESVRDGDAEA